MNVTNKIIDLCKKKTDSGFKELYAQTIRYVYSIVSSYISNPESVKDVIQDTYAAVFTSIKKYDYAKGPFKPWLRAICVNCCIQHYRKQNKFSAEIQFGEVLASTNIEEPDYDHFTRADIILLLSQMPDGYRTIFLLVEIDGYDHGEVSEMLGITKETSRSQLHRGKNWLKKNLNPKLLNKYGIQRV